MYTHVTSFVFLLTLFGFVHTAPLPIADGSGGSAFTGEGGEANGGNVYKYTSGLINLDVLNIGSGNAGAGGLANSGSAVGGIGGCQAGGTGGSAYTDKGGQANGGNVYEYTQGGLLNLKALNIGSGNAGQGGSANSGSAFGGNANCG